MAPEPLEARVCRIQRLIGVYDADGTLRGELSYWVGARLGRAHCGLCDITHGLVRERRDWQTCRATLPVPFETYHRDDQPRAVAELVGAELPAVVAETEGGGLVQLLGPIDLEACQGSPEMMQRAMIDAAEAQNLAWGRST